MEVKNFTKEEQEKIMTKYVQLSFANLKRNIVQDLINSKGESVIYKKYTKEQIVNMLENPQKNEDQIRELSRFIYLVSSHYRRLVDYYSTILLYNYTVIPTKIPVKKPNKTKYTECYYHVVNECEKYNLQQEATEALKIAVRDGVFFGICYENEDSFYIKPFTETKFAKISSIEDGVFRYSIDMAYFSGKEYLLDMYGAEFKNAYLLWKGDKEKGTKGDKSKKWYEVPNGIVVKCDKSNFYNSIPLFASLLLDILSIDDYKLLQKAKVEGDNYKILGFKLDVDENGVPKIDYELAAKYFNTASETLPDGVGAILVPFDISDHSFQSSTTSNINNVSDSINAFWQSAGTPSSLFGGGNINSSGAMSIAVRPDEALAFAMLSQFERFFNVKIKKMSLDYSFKLKFSRLSIFNQDEYANRLSKAASLGMPVKSEYISALGFSPSDMLGMTYLEEQVLMLSKKSWLNPLISSNTQSSVESEGGRPTSEERGETIGEAGEQTRTNESNGER